MNHKRVIGFFAILLLISLLLPSLSSCELAPKRKYTDYCFDYFDTVTTVIGYAANQNEFDEVADEVKRQLKEYHELYDIYHTYEGINNLATLNRERGSADNPIKLDRRITELLEFSLELYEKTDGYVNIAMGSVLSLWHERREAALGGTAALLPDRNELQAASEHTDISGIVIDKDKSSAYLSDSELLIDVGAIAKGYAAERIARSLEEKGISGFVLNVGGNVRTIGSMPSGEPWQVAIENPDKSDTERPYIEYLALNGESVVTSGSYQRFYTVDGKRYHHIIDKDTLYPAEGYLSVSVICSDSGVADALSTALFCVEPELGKKIISRFEGAACVFVKEDGTLEYSESFSDFLQ